MSARDAGPSARWQLQQLYVGQGLMGEGKKVLERESRRLGQYLDVTHQGHEVVGATQAVA